ncbi:unnamed protein product [Prorocentrum cordatum]|uniref:Uncharacterized protein n=1 Tax=Prorocentrum cordatum TaxID=2364126 RepID=A0ABN9WFF4_9DINO|nr:unnamed protein product [Polarella glacialis]
MLPFKGKQVLIKLICGGALPKELSENEFAKMLVRTARFLRWLAVGLCPEQFKLLESAQHKWLEASLASYMWQGVEDHCLEQWVDFVMEEKVSHVSLHFDGLRVDKGRALLSQAGGDAQATAVSDAEKRSGGLGGLVAAVLGAASALVSDMCESDVAPLCVGIDVKQRGPHKCYVGRERWSLPAGALDEAVLAALDRCMVVAFQMKPADRDDEDHRDSSLDGALDLFAGAGIEDNVAAVCRARRRRSLAARVAAGSPSSDRSLSPPSPASPAAQRGAAALRELGCSIRGIVPFDRRRLTWHGNCIPFGIAALTGDWDGVIAAATVDSDENAAAMASGLRRYSDCANLFGVSLRPVPTTAVETLGRFLVHGKVAGREHCAAVEVFEHGGSILHSEGLSWDVPRGCLDACLRIILDFGVEAAFALGGGHSSTLGDDVAARDAMGMVAGAGVEEEGAVDVANAGDEHAEELDDDSCARVHANLLQLLRDEVTDFEMIVKSLSRTGATKDGNGSVARCLLCPFKEYSTSSVNVKRDLLAHIANHHGLHRKCENGRDRKMGSGRYVASGTKQWKVIQALFDDDMLSKHQPKNLLQRSADLMRRSVSPPLRCLGVDKQIRLLLDHDGPRFVNFEVLARDGALQARRVGNTYYTKEFAELVFRESILHEGRVRPMRARIVTRFKEAGSCVTHLLPGKVVQWLSLMEDVFSSPFVEELRTNLMGELVDNTEFEHVSLDATLRAAMRVKGQANYREPAEIRAAAPFPDGVAKRRILTAKGRTSAAIGMWPVASEAASVVKAALRNHLPERALQQCVSVASDDPSATLFAELKQIMPQLKFLCLDPVHLAIVYNQAHWRKHSPGQAVLRIILNKFNKVSSDLNGAAWGAPYTGHQASSLSAAEGRAQSLIAGGGMQKRRAHKIIADLDANEPFVRKLEFIEALAALTSVHWEEVDRRTPAAPSRKLADVIANAAQHSRCEYLFNNLRMRHSLPARALPLLGSGTSPNEALHSEINKWFKNQPELYAQTLELQLGVNVIGKQMMHNSAMYAPTLRQLSSQTVAASVVCSFAISAAEWANHCASQAQEQRAPRKAQLPLALQRKAAEPLANKWKVDHKRMVVARKPAGQQQFIRTLKRPGAAKQRKRTPFSLVRKRS